MADLSGELLGLRNFDYLANADDQSGITALSWEAAIQKHIEEELYPSSSEVRGEALRLSLYATL